MVAIAQSYTSPALPRLPLEPDLFGDLLRDHQQGRPSDYFLRRDDNYLERENSARYFRRWAEMMPHQRCLLSHAAGKVLEVGTGAGQYALALQQCGMAVTAIDSSAGAVSVCRQRGIRDVRLLDARALDFPEMRYDTILCMGHNLGLTGTPAGLRRLLRDLRALVTPQGQLLAEFADYAGTYEQAHLRYHRHNRSLGAYPGTIRLRMEYAGLRGPDFEWLLITLEDFRSLCVETGWHIRRCIQVDDQATYAICLGTA